MNNRFKILAAFAGLLTALTAGSSAAQTCVNPPSGLVSWWRAEGNALDSAGSNNGALSGGASFATGEVGQAFSFDGTGEVAVPSSPADPTAGARPRTVQDYFGTRYSRP